VQKFPLIKERKCVGCCFLLGIRRWSGTDKFVIVDGHLGVFVVDFAKEHVEQVWASTQIVSKWGSMFADDFDFIGPDTIAFSDLSAKCSPAEAFGCFFGGIRDSRLIQLNLKTREAKVLLDDQLGLNGIQTHADKQSVLIAQSLLSKIIRYYFAGPKAGKVEVFADGLPGLPDNIRASKTGDTYWVAFFRSRAPGDRVLAQRWGSYPAVRSALHALAKFTTPQIFAWLGEIGQPSGLVIVELDGTGKVVKSLHDTDKHFSGFTQVTDGGAHLYLSSIFHNFIVKVKKP